MLLVTRTTVLPRIGVPDLNRFAARIDRPNADDVATAGGTSHPAGTLKLVGVQVQTSAGGWFVTELYEVI